MVDSGHMTKGRCNHTLLRPVDDLSQSKASPLGRCCPSGVDLDPFPNYLEFAWDASGSVLRKKKKKEFIFKEDWMASSGVLLRPINASLGPWVSETAPSPGQSLRPCSISRVCVGSWLFQVSQKQRSQIEYEAPQKLPVPSRRFSCVF